MICRAIISKQLLMMPWTAAGIAQFNEASTITSSRRQKTAINYARLMGTTRNKSKIRKSTTRIFKTNRRQTQKRNQHNADSWSSRRCHLTVSHGTYRYAGWLSDYQRHSYRPYVISDWSGIRKVYSLLRTISQGIEDALQSIQEMSMRILTRCCIRHWNNWSWAHLWYHTNCLLWNKICPVYCSRSNRSNTSASVLSG